MWTAAHERRTLATTRGGIADLTKPWVDPAAISAKATPTRLAMFAPTRIASDAARESPPPPAGSLVAWASLPRIPRYTIAMKVAEVTSHPASKATCHSVRTRMTANAISPTPTQAASRLRAFTPPSVARDPRACRRLPKEVRLRVSARGLAPAVPCSSSAAPWPGAVHGMKAWGQGGGAGSGNGWGGSLRL